ncbi:leucine-rich repeat-containing protein 61 [Hemicordylus capensis]|uniref:leucine-rich repeat-containing protein 61 n=1 Tax=Hemicordylus capensis TaxID=884348 RepID=UPI0023048924|nr:leucine-rich repeat-containing protein 61 [Hemicordylus capensis]XP_053119323.1 leucine-rich repeat-containing protein 61 [Hemicordylus capensis]XP_053119324.1 leucine-rich repeat-containing protein 61 [Hemicordylus capensis]XP_053119326.1 leucine-rich repeat-containing protein 61 [Hemicordylus capensis]XP_053119327.1 leucine-rich repeat-containing protein 61 [Hemicordylus capensis]XP_053119328.1 leucine-rich repeat-containing protein 61 [Hemicordylus capensis]
MEPRTEKGDEGENVRITSQLLKAKTGEFDLESILLLKLRGLGIMDLGCLGECVSLEWLDLSGNAITHLGPLSSLKALAVLNISSNRITSLEPLSGCENLQSLNAAGNLLSSLQQLQGLAGLRHLESLRFTNPVGRLSNPLCTSIGYRVAMLEMFPGVKVIDGERVLGRGSELYQLCKDLDNSLKRFSSTSGAGITELASLTKPWVEEGYWDLHPARRSSIMEEAYKQFNEVLQECRELSKRADDTISQVERALNIRPDSSSYVF